MGFEINLECSMLSTVPQVSRHSIPQPCSRDRKGPVASVREAQSVEVRDCEESVFEDGVPVADTDKREQGQSVTLDM